MSSEQSDYYLGLDVGTGSVGWAVVDGEFRLKNFNAKNTWGVRLFPSANTNTDRRAKRTARRHYQRRSQRLVWLRDLLRDSMGELDPGFFDRLDMSQFHLGDTVDGTYLECAVGAGKVKNNENSLFDDNNYQDADYYRDFPTVWHLREHLGGDMTGHKKVDLRHFYLAIAHILKHRGHFLFSQFSASDFETTNATVSELIKYLPLEKYTEIKNYKYSPDTPNNPKDVLQKGASKESMEVDENNLTSPYQLINFIFGGKKTVDDITIELAKFEDIADQLESILDSKIFAVLEETYKYQLFLEAKYLLGYTNNLEDYYIQKYQDAKESGAKVKLRKTAFPMQLNEESLGKILKNMPVDEEVKEKVKQIFRFRIPYYVGPLDDRSQHSWIVRRDGDDRRNITPWNFSETVDENATKTAFYKSLIARCTFLPREYVLAKDTILNQKYLVLEQINNIKLGGARLDKGVKKIIWEAFLSGKQTKTSLAKLLKNHNIMGELKLPIESRKGVEKEIKLHQMSSYVICREVFGEGLDEKRTDDFITNLAMGMAIDTALENAGLRVGDAQKENLKKLKTDGWSRYSRKFLEGIKNTGGQTITQQLEETTMNIMELLGDFQKSIDEENSNHIRDYREILDERWFNPIAKRPIIQALKIIAELKRTFKKMPAEIFIESTRDLDVEGKNSGRETASKAQELKGLGLYEGGDYDSISNKKFLFSMQRDKDNVSRCIYCRQPLTEATAEIEHIEPRAKKFSDSLRDNLVLSCRDCNQKKGDIYPIPLHILTNDIENTKVWWDWLEKNKRIAAEKHRRLTSSMPIDSLGFLPSQLVATGIIGTTLKTILKIKYPNTKITFVKPSLSKILRAQYSRKDETTDEQITIKPEFVKSRTANNFHHAKDAYLAIIAGRVYTYISDKYRNIGAVFASQYSMSKLFYPTTVIGDGGRVWSETHFDNMVRTMRKNKNEQFCMTYQVQYGNGQFFDETLYRSKKNKIGGIEATIPRKKGLPPEKYGGFSSKKTFGFEIRGGSIKLVSTMQKEGRGKIIGANQTILINDDKNVLITKYDTANNRLGFDHTKYNFEFSDEYGKLINRLEKLFGTNKWTEKTELIEKFNIDELLALLKCIDAQIPKSVVNNIKIVEKYTSDRVVSLRQLEKRLRFIKLNSGGKEIENSGGKNLNSYINKSDIKSLQVKHQSITGLWQIKGQ